MTETVRLSGVGFGYVGAPDVLRDVNLILPRGSFHFLTGPSGAGKSSLLKLLTLAARPRAGTIHLFGQDVTRIARRDAPACGNTHLGMARALVEEMPYTMAALEAGALSEYRALLIVRESACLTVEDRRRLDVLDRGMKKRSHDFSYATP